MAASSRSSNSAKRANLRKNEGCIELGWILAVAIKRIIPVSSGKGGVGKTTFAINFTLALTRHGRTVLIDLYTGTSAIRNAIDVPIQKDLYHFFRKGEKLDLCITPLDDRMDRERRYPNFGFI